MINLLVIQKGMYGLSYPSTLFCILTLLPFRYAYVEFSEPEHIDAALALDNSLFRGRLIKVGYFLLTVWKNVDLIKFLGDC